MAACTGGGGSGTRLTYAQLMGDWTKNGGPAAVAAVAAAIAEAESGGCTTALNPNDNGGRQSSFGLWQISNGTHTPPSSAWADPNVNAQLAVAKYKGAGNAFTPWGTFNSGAYKGFLNGSTTADPNVPGGSGAVLASATQASDATCAASWPVIGGGKIAGVIPMVGIGGGCAIRKSTLRHLAGGGLIMGGALVILPGVILLAAFTFRASGAQQALRQSAPYVRVFAKTPEPPLAKAK